MQAHAEQLAHQLKRKRHQVVIAARAVSKNPNFQDFFYFSEPLAENTVNGHTVHHLRHSRAMNPVMALINKSLGRSWAVNGAVATYQSIYSPQIQRLYQGVDIIHYVGQAHEMIGFAAAAASRKLGIPFVIQPTSHPGQWGDSPLDQRLYRLADRLLVHTEFEKKALSELGVDRPYDVVGNGVVKPQRGDPDRFRRKHGLPGDIVLFLGRQTEDKGFPTLRAAFELVRQKLPETKLLCIGPEGNRDSSAGVIELGFVSEEEKTDALAACQILCVPSEGESFGLVYMEAGLQGKPSIARRLPVLEELLGQHEAIELIGKPVGTGNQVALESSECADAIIKLLQKAEYARRMGEAAGSVAQNFLWPRVVQNFENAYARALESKPLAAPSAS